MMDEETQYKSTIRKWAKEERKKLDIESLSNKLIIELQKTEEYQQAKNIMIFYPLKYEINLLELLNDSTKKFYLPKINGDDLLCCPYANGDELCESCFKTKEPVSEESNAPIDLVIVPALVVDKNNYRLGYGGGYYDRFLARVKCKTIVCIPEQFLIDTIYPEKFDIPIDKIIMA